MSEQTDREKTIIRTSVTGILTNLFLVAFKLLAGILANSIAVILDAVNNLSDAASSIITIVGIRLANKSPDKKHPLGYGRIEYLSALAVACLVFYAGATSLVESVKKMFHPGAPDYSALTLVIIAVGVVVKLVLGRHVKKIGEAVHSGSLVASGEDARFDAVLSASVFACALLYLFAGVNLEAYVGAFISLIILKSGFEMLKETVDDLLGASGDPQLSKAVKETVREADPAIEGAYDLILHSYGPGHTVGSIHIAVKDTMRADEIDALSRKLSAIVYQKYGILLTGIGIYSSNTKNDIASSIQSKVTDMIMQHDGVLQIHGFYADERTKQMSFDLILSWNIENRQKLFEEILKEVKEAYPGWQVRSTLDLDL